MRVSVLDVLPTSTDHSAPAALQSAVQLAQLIDRAGYHRLWYAEHHGMPSIASTSPELLIAHVGSATSQVRLGAGGVMLPNHAPLRVVEQYRTLEALFPGRIDLGIGRAAGTDPLTAHALRSASGEHFPELLEELLAFERGGFPKEHPYHRIAVTPADVALPPMWMLGSSGGSARLAGQLGLGYAFAAHFSPLPARGPIDAYRSEFQPSAAFQEPRVILAVHALCAETEEQARELALAPLFVLAQLERGRMVPVQHPREVRAAGFRHEDATGVMAQRLVYGAASQVRDRLQAMANEVSADELMVMTLAHQLEPRLQSYRLLAEAFAS